MFKSLLTPLALVGSLFAVSANASLVSSYDFNGGFSDTLGANSDLTYLGHNVPDGILEFSEGNGVEMNGVIQDGGEYNLEVAFSFNDSSGYNAFLSFNELNDSMLYIVNNRFLFYGKPSTYSSTQSMAPNTPIVFGLSRKQSGEFSYYLNGEKIKTEHDSENALLLTGENTKLSFFIDDSTENLTGELDYIRVYDNVADLVGERNAVLSDVPISFVFSGIALLGLGFYRRK